MGKRGPKRKTPELHAWGQLLERAKDNSTSPFVTGTPSVRSRSRMRGRRLRIVVAITIDPDMHAALTQLRDAAGATSVGAAVEALMLYYHSRGLTNLLGNHYDLAMPLLPDQEQEPIEPDPYAEPEPDPYADHPDQTYLPGTEPAPAPAHSHDLPHPTDDTTQPDIGPQNER